MKRVLPPAPGPAGLLLRLLVLATALEAAVVLTGNAEQPLLAWLSTVVILLAGVAAIWRAAQARHDRLAFLMLGLACVAWGGAEIVNAAWIKHLDAPPVPSAADVLWFAYYPFTIAGVALLVRRRVGRVPSAYWFDAAIAVAAVGAAALVLSAGLVAQATGPNLLATIINVGYPAGDLVTLLLVVSAMIVCRDRLTRGWVLLMTAQAACIVADTAFLLSFGAETWTPNNPLSLGYPVGALLLALAVWQLDGPAAVPADDRPRSSSLLLSAVSGGLAICLLVSDHFDRIPTGTVLMAMSALALLIIRLVIVLRQNVVLLEIKHREASTDPLTGLGNRRRLLADLERASEPDAEQAVLGLFDLDGFKRYNDTFGHPAGDRLLVRLGGRLQAMTAAHGGSAYRLGGDEFCAVLPLRARTPESLAAEAAAALREHGDAFSIGSSWGAVTIPCAGSAADALRQADQRMYGQKSSSRPSAARQTLDVLLAATRERTPDLGDHVDGVAELAGAIAVRLSMDATAAERVCLAAELHDIGKIAIPDAILHKPGPLDEQEWAFMRRHTLIGERILQAAPDLQDVAKLVRSSHERWDGGGYPDGRAGAEIPIGSRIISVCDAFDAMISRRPYSEPMSTDDAVAEVMRCAGSQFDPLTAAALRDVLAERRDLLQDDAAAAIPAATGAAS
jgi:diguanylate cyclase (GGDEF)-like protein